MATKDIADNSGSSEGALTVSAALALAKGSLEALTVRIVGEVSEVSVKPGYKAAYFTVKDTGASLPCMMWNNRYRDAGFDLAVGQLVELTGRFTLYAAKGRMNFDVFSVALAGEGDLRLRVANLARKLQAEGLTESGRKRPLPPFPASIGLVTSPRSAAVHDVLRTLRRRYPEARILLAGVPVEGASAPSALTEGLQKVAAAGAEVVLVVRGGGSFEDLMPFNDEGLARAIAACPVPVVTGIGHEVDTTIADMVSDLRASTPTAAAEAVSPSRESMDALFSSRSAAMEGALRRRFERTRGYLQRIADKALFQDSMMLFAAEAQWLDTVAERLERVLPAKLEAMVGQRLALEGRLQRTAGPVMGRFRYEVSQRAARLEDLSPLAILARGYAIARTPGGAVVGSVGAAVPGEPLEVALADGYLDCTVNAIREGAPRGAREGMRDE